MKRASTTAPHKALRVKAPQTISTIWATRWPCREISAAPLTPTRRVWHYNLTPKMHSAIETSFSLCWIKRNSNRIKRVTNRIKTATPLKTTTRANQRVTAHPSPRIRESNSPTLTASRVRVAKETPGGRRA